MKIRYYIVFLFLICIKNSSISQLNPITEPKTVVLKDSLVIPVKDFIDTIDTLPKKDSMQMHIIQDTADVLGLDYKLSKDAIDDDINYGARDSSWTTLDDKKIILYGKAWIAFQDIKVQADSIIIDFTNQLVHAYRTKIRSREQELPSFSEGANLFNYEEMTFNYDTKKGFVKDAKTIQGDFFLLGSKTKFISGQTDSLGIKMDDIAFNEDAIITTCNHSPPHFGIRTNKLKLIPNKLAVLSLAQVEIAGVPTPLILPFGFFPLIKGRSSGLIMPSSYEYNDQLGLGIREIGFYFPISNYMDLKVNGDIYTRGTHGVRLNTNYKKRYGYTGNIILGYANNIAENPLDGRKSSQKSFIINIRHDQDPKAHPYRKIGGSINIQSNRYDQRVYENPNAVLTNQYKSSFSFAHQMPGTPFHFNAEFNHSQNTMTRQMEITFPNMSLRMNTLYPLKPKNATKEKWTHRIALTYSSEFRNFVRTTDTTLFTAQTLKDMQTGLQNKIGLSNNFRILKYFNLSPTINYEETWLTKKYQLSFNPDSVRIDDFSGDTLGFKAPVPSFVSDFSAFRQFRAAISVNTQIFGTIRGGSGFFRGIRHVIKPNVSFGYMPENRSQYEAIVNTDTRDEFNRPITYSSLSNGPFGTINGTQQQMALSYGITNIIEAKYFSKKDGVEKKVRIFDNININGNYNFAADSFRWSPINISGNTRILKGITNFNFRALFSPYQFDENNSITQQTVWENGKILPEFRNFGGQFTTGISFGQIREILVGKPETENKPNASGKSPTNKNQDESPLSAWFENFNVSHSLNFELQKVGTRDTFLITSHSIHVSGTIPLTKNWSMNIGNIAYDLKSKSLVYPYFSFARDLHCWQMNFTWAPSNGVYNFFIGVKSGALNFLKYDYLQRNANTLFTGQR